MSFEHGVVAGFLFGCFITGLALVVGHLLKER